MIRAKNRILLSLYILSAIGCSSAATLDNEIIRITQHTPMQRMKRDASNPTAPGEDFPQQLMVTLHLKDNDIQLRLEKHVSPFDVRLFSSQGDHILDSNHKRNQYVMYQDTYTMSAMTVECWEDVNNCELSGTFFNGGKQWTLHPMDNRPGEYTATEAPDVVKTTGVGIPVDPLDTNEALNRMNEELLDKFSNPTESVSHSRQKRTSYYSSTCNIIETMVIADSLVWNYYMDQQFGDTLSAYNELVRHFLTLFNQVDLRYKCLGSDGLCLRVYLSEIYIKYYEVLPADALQSLYKCSEWKSLISSYTDLAHCSSRQDMALFGNVTYRCFGWLGSICTWPYYSATTSEDQHDAMDLLIAHAFGYVFGSDNDGLVGCDDSDDFLQSELNPPPSDVNKGNPWKFSTCGNETIRTYINQLDNYNQNCLKSGSLSQQHFYDLADAYPLPGKVYDLDHQCRLAFGHTSVACIADGQNSTFELDDMCHRGVYCFVNGACTKRTRVYNGSPCGCKKSCFKDFCVRDFNVALGDACTGCCECEDDNAYCDCDTKTCQCKTETHFEDNGLCVPYIDNEGNCTQPNSCADENAECKNNLCQCKDGYFLYQGNCIEFVCIDDACVTNQQCDDVNATCVEVAADDLRCRCAESERVNIFGNCETIMSIELGENCTRYDTCEDTNSFCHPNDWRCECLEGFFASDGNGGGECLTLIPNGDNCTVLGSCEDCNAYCNMTCQCEDGFVLYDTECIPVKNLCDSCEGNQCDSINGVCEGDVCKCSTTQYVDECGNCVDKVETGDNCTADVECSDDKACCREGFCQCSLGTFYNETTMMCEPNVQNGGSCTQNNSCVDANAECSDDICQCKDGYFLKNGDCVKYKLINEMCSDDGDCLPAINAMCKEGKCKCPDTDYLDRCGICMEKVGTGDNCTADAECSDDKACCREGFCQCSLGTFYNETTMMCEPNVQHGGSCTQNNSCVDANAECSDDICQCKDGYFLKNGDCVKYKLINEMCSDDGDCLPAINAMCKEGKCKCPDTDYLDLCGICMEKVETSDNCTTDAECLDDKACCREGSCQCDLGTFYNETTMMCEPYVENGGSCTQNNSCADANAECSNDTCQCIGDYFLKNAACVEYRLINEMCSDNNECSPAINAMCIGGKCKCTNTQYEDCGICKANVDLNQDCSGDSRRAVCDDDYAYCNPDSLICLCIPGYVEIDGMCMPKVQNEGNCTQNNSCADDNAECNDDTCQCMHGYFLKDGECIKYKLINEMCSDDNECLPAINAMCIGGKCKCTNTHYEDCGICKETQDLRENCTMSSQCEDENAYCNEITGECECGCDWYHSNGQLPGGFCEPKQPLGQNCTASSQCIDNNADCISGVCACPPPYVEVNGTCVPEPCDSGACAEIEEACQNGTECCDLYSDCIDNKCKCSFNSEYNNDTGVCDVPNGFVCIEYTGGEDNCLDDNAVCEETEDCCELTCQCIETYYKEDCNSACLPRPIEGDNCTVPDDLCDDLCFNSTCKAGVCAGGVPLGGDCGRAAVSCAEYPATKCVTYNSQQLTPNATLGHDGNTKICLCDDNQDYFQYLDFCICNSFTNNNPKCTP